MIFKSYGAGCLFHPGNSSRTRINELDKTQGQFAVARTLHATNFFHKHTCSQK